jgi:hypothetical protein
MLILPLGWSEAAAGGGWENDCDLKDYWRYSGGRWSAIYATVGLHVQNTSAAARILETCHGQGSGWT